MMALKGEVSYTHPKLLERLPQYKILDDVLGGELVIKAAGDIYMPRPNASDESDSNKDRFNALILRANFYNVTFRTLQGLVGQIYTRDPNIEIPSRLDAVKNDVSGEGIGIIEQSKQACGFVLSKGRAGLFTDYPATEASASVTDIESGKIRPTITLYEPKSIVNWRTITKGAKTKLSLVVLSETYVPDEARDSYEIIEKKQWRVLRLEDGLYIQEIYREDQKEVAFVTYKPKDARGNRLDEIPFTFIGPDKNDTEVAYPPLYDLASLNISHYQVNGDYRESCFLVGQPTLVLSGLTDEWFKETLGGNVRIGSRSGIPLPVNADAKYLQAESNSMQFECMEHLEKQMVALGAKLVENKEVARTLGEAKIENAAETSVLASIAKNVAQAYKWSLEWCAIFTGLADMTNRETGGIVFDLNTEFDLVSLTPEERKQLMAEWQAGAILESEYRANLLRAGIGTVPLEEYQQQKEVEVAANIDLETEKAKKLADAVRDPAETEPVE